MKVAGSTMSCSVDSSKRLRRLAYCSNGWPRTYCYAAAEKNWLPREDRLAIPSEPLGDVDVILFQITQELEGNKIWSGASVNAALIAISDYESPTILKLLLDTRAHGVISKPFRSSGILSTLVLARASYSYQERLQGKIDKLELTIKSRRQIEKAIRVLVERQKPDRKSGLRTHEIAGNQAACNRRRSVRMIIEAHEGMERLGLKP